MLICLQLATRRSSHQFALCSQSSMILNMCHPPSEGYIAVVHTHGALSRVLPPKRSVYVVCECRFVCVFFSAGDFVTMLICYLIAPLSAL